MSRIVWFCIPAWGHTNPTVEVVRALTARGHQVRYYTFAPFWEKLEAAGAEVRLCDEFMPLRRRIWTGGWAGTSPPWWEC